jgi:hypothetical protein
MIINWAMHNVKNIKKPPACATCLEPAWSLGHESRVPYLQAHIFSQLIQVSWYAPARFGLGRLAVLTGGPPKPSNITQARPIFKHDTVLCCLLEPCSCRISLSLVREQQKSDFIFGLKVFLKSQPKGLLLGSHTTAPSSRKALLSQFSNRLNLPPTFWLGLGQMFSFFDVLKCLRLQASDSLYISRFNPNWTGLGHIWPFSHLKQSCNKIHEPKFFI